MGNIEVAEGFSEDIGEMIEEVATVDIVVLDEGFEITTVVCGGTMLPDCSLSVVGAGFISDLEALSPPFPLHFGPLQPLQPFLGHGRLP
jgi:hypothetical protein